MGKAKIIPAPGLFLPFQTAWIQDGSRLKLMEKSRQIGVSWSSAYGIVRRKSLAGAKLDAWVTSRDEIQARLFIEDCKKFAELLNIAAQDYGCQVIDDKGSTAYILQLSNGLKIYSMSSNPDAQAGKRGDRFLDEFALHKDPRKLYSIAFPGITWGGQLEIVSTHRGSANYFNELIREIKEKGNKKGISLHTVTLQTALDQGFLFKLQAKLPPDDPRQEMDEADYFNFIKSGCADAESFLQEYCCMPADDASAFLEYDLIAACEMTDQKIEVDSAAPEYVGVDVGRKKDLTVIWRNAYTGGRHITQEVIELKNRKFSEQEEILYAVLRRPNMRRCCIDATGIGMQLAERAIDMFGSYRVEAVMFSGPVKEALAYPLRAAFEDKNVLIPFAPEIRADLRAIRKETTAAGNIRFSADRSENGHADRFWSLALAIHASGADGGPAFAVPWQKPQRDNNDLILPGDSEWQDFNIRDNWRR